MYIICTKIPCAFDMFPSYMATFPTGRVHKTMSHENHLVLLFCENHKKTTAYIFRNIFEWNMSKSERLTKHFNGLSNKRLIFFKTVNNCKNRETWRKMLEIGEEKI
jgi:hypothetical protein